MPDENFFRIIPKDSVTSDIKKVYIFDKNALLLKSDGIIYGIGKNENWLLGDSNENIERPICYAVKSEKPEKFKDFVTNGEHALAISRAGFLLSWGSDKFDQLGRKGSYGSIAYVTKIFGLRVAKAACGRGFSVILTTEGKLYEWGKNGFKELTLELCTEANSSICKEEENEWAVNTIICTVYYPIALTKNGKVFLPTFSQSSNKCSDSLHYEKMKMFGEILKDKKVVELSSGKSCVFALTDAGDIFYWKIHSNSASEPSKIEANIGRPIKLWASSSHDVLLISNSYGQLFSIYYSGSGECLSVSQLSFESVAQCFSSLGMQMSGPAYDQNMAMYDRADDPGMFTKWKSKFELAFNKKEKSDIAFSVGKEIIYAHEAIVTIQSSYLEAMLKNWCSEEMNNRTVVIDKYSYPTYLRFLRYLYTGRLEISSHESTMEMIRLASEYMDKPLIDTCQKMLTKGFTAENVYATYEFANLFELEDLRTACKLFMSKNLEEVVFDEDLSSQKKEDLLKSLKG